MTRFSFIHTSDLHLGRRFANIPEPEDGNIRGRLMEARHAVLGKLAKAARSAGAAHVLLAGDTFDTAMPSASLIRQTLAEMAGADHVQWWILPGNHDNLADGDLLWETVSRDRPANVTLLTETQPVDMAPGVTLLPCPLKHRATGTDPSAAMVAMPSPEGHLRLGLAHGGVVDFTESGDVIAPNRDQTARLDYLALGDWHGRLAVSARVHYPGSPEQDRFKHGRRGVCLAVVLDGPGATPRIDEVETGAFLWDELELALHPRQDANAALTELLPRTGRRDMLLRVNATGWVGLSDLAALQDAAQAVAPDFAHFDLLTKALRTQYDTDDLDQIDRAGAVRVAANALQQEAEDDTRSQADRQIAADALARLYAYVMEARR